VFEPVGLDIAAPVGRSSQERLRQGPQELKMLAMPNVRPVEGGIPLIRGGKIGGGVRISGARSTQNTQIAQAAVTALNSFRPN
jgi:uncharacterized protein GlcG (DUF336 family)